jgi:hypothetical protein
MDKQPAESYGEPSIEGLLFGATGRAGATTPVRPLFNILQAASPPPHEAAEPTTRATLGRRPHPRQGFSGNKRELAYNRFDSAVMHIGLTEVDATPSSCLEPVRNQ